jgi:hypothetical protein
LPTISGNNSNLSIIDEQQAAAAAKRKEDNVVAAAQAVAAIAHWEQEPLIAVVTAACKTLDEARARECATSLAWEKKKTIARHLKQQLIAAQGITLPHDDNDDRSINAGSNPDATLTAHLHAQAANLQSIRSVVTIILEPSSPN